VLDRRAVARDELADDETLGAKGLEAHPPTLYTATAGAASPLSGCLSPVRV
jgi:hypothetical protein